MEKEGREEMVRWEDGNGRRDEYGEYIASGLLTI